MQSVVVDLFLFAGVNLCSLICANSSLGNLNTHDVHSDLTISSVTGGRRQSGRKRLTDRKAELKWDEKRSGGDDRGGGAQKPGVT